MLFVIGITIELCYWIFTRIILCLVYRNTYGLYKSTISTYISIFTTTIITFLPSDMIIFFGYEGNQPYD